MKSGKTLILSEANIVDVSSGNIINNMTIVIEQDRIIDISDKKISGEHELNLRDHYVLPGLFNVHNNLTIDYPFSNVNPNESETVSAFRFYSKAFEAAKEGITTLRTVGEMHRVDIHIRNLIKKNLIQGPTIFAGGKGLGITGGHGSGFGMIEADGPDEFSKYARKELSLGADHLKIFATGGIAKIEEDLTDLQMSKNEIEAVVNAAKTWGTYVAAHISGSDAIIEAAEAGVTCFEHGYIMNRRAARAIKDVNGYLVPTLSVTRSPEWMRNKKFDEQIIEKSLSIKDLHSSSFLTAIDEGVTIVCGTDLPPADLNDGINATVREIEFMTELGMNLLDALKTATLNAAKLCRAENYLGAIKKGYQADIIAVPKNPLKNIRSLEQIKLVLRRGEVMKNEIL
ncbi:MAG: amidohydrolase family protein [Thermoproteota archaeon]